MDVGVWLNTLGLGQYAEAFAENDIDAGTLDALTSDDLKELGVSSLGHRKKLLTAIAEWAERAAEPEPLSRSLTTAHSVRSEAERRQLTVMFVDLVGSTELSRTLDPEDLRDLMRRYQDAVAGATTRYGGHVAKYLGDGVLAYFGWPQAYEDQAERAVHAGLDCVAAVAAVGSSDGPSLSARVGIATGEVVVGDLVGERGRDREAVSGETPNLAARLQQIAGPGQVVVSDRTRRLFGGAFELTDHGRQDLKGFGDAVQAWAVLGEPAADSRFGAAHGSSLTPLVGREAELALLLDRWQLAEDGEGQLVLISGEAGIGKSRLLEGFHERLSNKPHIRIRYQCSPYHTNSALHPTIRQLEGSARFAPDDSADTRLDKLEALLAAPGDVHSDDLRLIAHLLSLPYKDRYGVLDQPPQLIKEQLLETLVSRLLRLSEGAPVLFLCEDSHWIDPTSQELLYRTVGRIDRKRVLMVITHRPEWQPPATGRDYVTSLHLNRLGKAQSTEIVHAIAGDGISAGDVERIVSRADGIPFFIEELAKSISESGPEISSANVPMTLQASLLARVDRLDPGAREVAQVGAAIGREFSHQLITDLVAMTGSDFDASMAQLIDSEIVFRSGISSGHRYQFKHSLVQDAVYDSILRSRRRQLHSDIAEILMKESVGGPATDPEAIARHLVESGQPGASTAYWMAAANQALSRASYSEANTLVEYGLSAAAELAETPGRMATTADLLFLKYAAQYPLGDPQTLLSVLSEAESIVMRLGDADRISKVLSTQTYVLAANGQLEDAVEVGRRNVADLDGESDVNLFCHGKLMLGRALFGAGQYASAIVHIKEAMNRVGDQVEHGRDLHGLSHSINARAFLVLCHTEHGEFDEGRRQYDDALSLLESLKGGMHERLWISNTMGRLSLIEGDFERTIKELAPVLAHCESNYPVYFPRVASSLGAAYAATGDVNKGLSLLRKADHQSSSTGFLFGHALVLSQLADILVMAGTTDQAAIKAALAIEAAQNSGELGNEGWATCVLGEVCANTGDFEAATRHFKRALVIGDKLKMAPLLRRCQTGLSGVAESAQV